MKGRYVMNIAAFILSIGIALSACSPAEPPSDIGKDISADKQISAPHTQTDTELVRDQILNGREGDIHYSYYLPEDYNKDNKYFNLRGIYNYHGGGNIVFDDKNVLNWIISKKK